jgi:hypothetical protein
MSFFEDVFEIDDENMTLGEKCEKLVPEIAGMTEIRNIQSVVLDTAKTFKELGYKTGDELLFRKYVKSKLF